VSLEKAKSSLTLKKIQASGKRKPSLLDCEIDLLENPLMFKVNTQKLLKARIYQYQLPTSLTLKYQLLDYLLLVLPQC